MVNKRKTLFATLAVFGAFTSLLQVGYAKTSLKPTNNFNLPPFRDVSSVEVVPLTKTDNAVVVSSKTYNHVVTQNNTGEKVVLNASKKPMLFVAYWCPHCERTLFMWKKDHAKFPDLVFVGYPNGTKFAMAKNRAWSEIHYFHLPVKSSQVYFVIGNQQAKYVPQGFPNYIYAQHHQDKSLLGEHTWHVWQSVLKNK